VIDVDDVTLALIQAGSMVSTFTYVFTRGLGTQIGELRYAACRPRLLAKSLLSIDLLVPLITIATLVLLRPPANVSLGLLILAASPASPMTLRNISQAGGDRRYATSLHFTLALLAILTTPVTLEIISRATGYPLGISLLAVAKVVGVSVLLPILAGMIFNWRFPAAAKRCIRPLMIFWAIVFLTTIALVLLPTYRLLLTMDLLSYIAIIVITVGALVAGHLMLPGQPTEQSALALENATRNTDLTILIASTFAPLDKALLVLIPYVVVSSIICQFYAWFRGRKRDYASNDEPH
jgi:bile acid:Na+ symporter, BASS family